MMAVSIERPMERPEVHRRHPALELQLVGRGDQFIKHFMPPDTNIRTTGPVEDAFYEISQALLVVAPLRAGSGTRIKILEAWAAARPVVATPLAAEGLSPHRFLGLLGAGSPTESLTVRLHLETSIREQWELRNPAGLPSHPCSEMNRIFEGPVTRDPRRRFGGSQLRSRSLRNPRRSRREFLLFLSNSHNH
jgi:hypothetical protein